MRDIVGIGALNLDLIATRKRLLSVDPDLIRELSNKFEHGAEKFVTDDQIKVTLSQIENSVFEKHLGGSAFNAIHTIAALNPGLRLGYVGVAGTTNVTNLGFVATLEHFGVDTQCIKSYSENISGVCISYINNGERSLLTCPGINIRMSEYLSENYDTILNYVSHAKLIHVTSFFDSETPKILFRILDEAKRKNPWLELSFDPGDDWLLNPTPEVTGILRIADYLFLNNREFENLGHHRPGSDDLTTAKNILSFCANPHPPLIVLKRYNEIKLFYEIQGRLVCRRYVNDYLPVEVIEDATGAGDVFAGGFLTARLIPWMELSQGVELGLRLVKSKLLVGGSKNFYKFPAIFSEIINNIPLDRLDSSDS